jgi:ABC-2 type transport system ATP-binding protein
MEYLISATDLQRHFGPVKAVDGVSLHVAAGEVYGLVGSDGAGKTTTMRLLVGALLPDRGTISVGGWDVRKHVEQARAQVGYLSQRFSLYEDLTVLENIRFFAEVRGLRPDEWRPRSLEILDFVGLAQFKERPAGQLSGGMKQKLGLATALVSRPRVLLLDEPTTGVDPVTRQDFWQLVIKLVSQSAKNDGEDGRVAVLISTPYMDEASRCHRAGFMKAGRIMAEDQPSVLRARLADRVLELQGEPVNLLRRVAHHDPDVQDVAAFGDRLHLRVRKGTAAAVLERLPDQVRAQGGHVAELRCISPALEDVFIAFTGDEFGGQAEAGMEADHA